jgi:TolA-binding protein
MNHIVKLGATLCVAGALVVLGSRAARAAGEQCISQPAKDNLSRCPGGKFQSDVTKRRQVSFSTTVDDVKRKERQSDIKPINPTDIAKAAERDERRAKYKKKQIELLFNEIKGVENLLKGTKKKDKDRPRLLRRLAENYVELESAAFEDKVQNEVKAQELRSKKPDQAAKHKDKAEKAKKIIKVARDAAIKHYGTLKTDYAKYCETPDAKPGYRGCIDEVLYYLAYEYEQAGDFDNARKAYLQLTENFKDSRFVPNAFLAFGELFFTEAQGDPSKWEVAGNFYREVLKYDPPENKLWGYAAYKLGYVYWNQAAYDKAINEFKRVIEFGMKYAQLPNAKGLMDSARRDVIPVYALKGNPAKAYDFFRPISGDSGASSEKTYGMMEKLGLQLMDTGHYPEAIVLYRDLMKRNRSDEYCFYQTQIAAAVMADKSGFKDPIVEELKNTLAVYKEFIADQHSGGAKQRCANLTASALTETAMAWHLEAVGSGGVRGTGDAKTMEKSEVLYTVVVETFSSEQFRGFSFPRIVKEDWPTIPKIKYAMADLLYFQKKWEKCGPAFDSVVAEDPNGPNAPEAAFASVLCYQNIYAARHKDGSHRKGRGELPEGATGDAKGKKDKKKTDADKYAKKEFSEEQKGMIQAFDRYICYIKPPQGDREAYEQYVEVKYARARTYFEGQHWEEAAWAFRDVGINHADTDAGIYAAQLYLEALNVMGSRLEPPRASCYDHMTEDVPVFIKSYCEGKKAQDNDEQCQILFRIQRDIERLKAENLVKACDEKGGGADCIKKYEEAGNLYVAMWKKYAAEACEAKKPGCERAEEILYNAARAYQAARLVAKSIDVRKVLLNPRYNLQNTEAAKKATYEIGGNYQAIAVYDQAAEWYERFAKENPKMEKAPEALSDAVVLRLGLGQQDKAIEDQKLFNQQYGQRKPAQAAQIAFAIGAHYAEREEWKSAEKYLSGAMKQIDAQATPDVKLQAHGLLARTYLALGKEGNADTEYNKVRDGWKDPAAQQKAMDAAGGTEQQKLRRLAKALTAVGEALFHFAEKRRREVEKIAFPVYKGSGDRKEVEDHIKNKVKAWIDKKQPAIKDATAEYLKIVELKPSPPPQWVIAAGSSVGKMWGDFVKEFRSAPYPKQWDSPGYVPNTDPPLLWQELRDEYLKNLDEASDPQKKQAKAAFVTCLDYSLKYQYFDARSRACEEWLSKNYASEFHLIDEYRGAASWVNTPLDERSQPLAIGGQSYIVDTREREEGATGAKSAPGDKGDDKPAGKPAADKPGDKAAPKDKGGDKKDKPADKGPKSSNPFSK